MSLSRFKQSGRHLWVGILAIIATSSILLWADRNSRLSAIAEAQNNERLPHIAIVQHASIDPLDDGVRALQAALTQRGFGADVGATYTLYNAQGDFATANTIAKTVISDNLDLIMTVSTLSMQTVASANRLLTEPKKHLFGITTDPFGAGIGVSRERPLDHPPYLAGVGSNSPIRELFQMIKRIKPELKRIGLVWNPAEANSEASTVLARAVVKELDMELVEGNAENSSAAGEVAKALISRGVDVLWLSTDVTTTTARDVMIKAARQAGIPVISSLPSSADSGALIALGSSYYDVGFEQGQMAADILEGRDMATIPVINWTPVALRLNLTALEGLRSPWIIPQDVQDRAEVIFDANGMRKQDVPAPAVPEALKWQKQTPPPVRTDDT